VGAVEAVADRVAEFVNMMDAGHEESDKMKHRYTEKDKLRVPATGAEAVMGRADEILHITIDTREQTPLEFPGGYVMASKGTVDVFDYSLANDPGWSIERKSLQDFVQSVVLSKSWKRELAKIAKAQSRLLPVIYVCEFTFDAIQSFDYSIFKSGNITSQFIYRRVATLIYDFNVHVVFAGSRTGASYAVAVLLKRRKEALKVNAKTTPHKNGD